jgi:transcriptional regulator with XRE-family HTH domain
VFNLTEEYFAARLSQLREQKGYTARDMSLSMGQSESYINKIENRRIQPPISMLFVICDYLKVTPKDFFDESNNYPERLNGIIENLKKLDEEALVHIDGLVKKIVGKNNAKPV